MERYGVVDIGSNTVVLTIYEIQSGKPVILDHYSWSLHLISYQVDGHMNSEGIEKVKAVLNSYADICRQKDVTRLGGFVTEPWRNIDNQAELFDAFASTGIPVTPLLGREEARLDFYGSRLDCSDVKDGNAFDIGGGSTELISFANRAIIEAVSIPMGCVRRSALPLDSDVPEQMLKDALAGYPGLKAIKTASMIGIGGTVRAAGKLANKVYGGNNYIPVSQLEELFEKLVNEDPETVEAMKEVVDAGRQPVFLPGLSMMLLILHAFKAEEVRVSAGCVREGFLLKHMIEN